MTFLIFEWGDIITAIGSFFRDFSSKVPIESFSRQMLCQPAAHTLGDQREPCRSLIIELHDSWLISQRA